MNSAMIDKKKESILKKNLLGKTLEITIPGVLDRWYSCYISEISVHNNTIRYSIQHDPVKRLNREDHFYLSAAVYKHFIVKYCNMLDIKYHHLYIPPHKEVVSNSMLFHIMFRCPVTKDVGNINTYLFEPLYRKETLPMIYENFN